MHSIFAFNWRRYDMLSRNSLPSGVLFEISGRGLHSSIFRLNLSAFCVKVMHTGVVQDVLGGARGY